MKKSVEEIYQKKSQLEHILLRPDSYIGSVEATNQLMWVWDAENQKMVNKEISFVPGFYKIFDEILVNAADNKIRDPSMDMIKVSLDKENGEISIMNNGKGIPIQMHKEEKVYVPELIFGHLLTSSNYNDDEKKVVGGRNGYGAKLCNIFSKEFIVETACKSEKKKYKQIFRDNMQTKSNPQITSNNRGEEYTRITFKPDFAKFGMESIDDDTESLLLKRVYDLAGTVKGVKVYLNGERLIVSGFKKYISLYCASADTNVVYETFSDRWEIACIPSDGQFQQVSFVNSICTSKGGTHVNYITDQITHKLLEMVQKKQKSAPVKQFQIKNHLWVFVNCLIENPAFDSQTKENLTLKASAFGSKCLVGDEFVQKLKKTGIVEQILSWATFKQSQQLKKTDGAKRNRITGIPKLDDANNAGTRNANKCTLILTEGDSAKTLAVTGLSVVGRDNYGVFPLRGKLLNVREASHKQIMDNQEINNIKQIMGLQHGRKYMDTSSLRYGHLMIMTDQDHDGSHIKGLIINFIDYFWPELLRIPGFLCEFITPIVKCTKGKHEHVFYTLPEYEQWKSMNNDGKGYNIKYYKGLGTSTKEDARRYFQRLDEHLKVFHQLEDGEREMIDMAFSKKKADNRKEWLRNYQPGTFMNHKVDFIFIQEFINKELILFSLADNQRSIPCSVDGLKPGLRKILFACFKRNLVKDEIKVAQLAGYIAEHSAYHHGEQSLQSSIVGMAQNFCGSNNVNLLEPLGQFGSRLQGGKDAASARYIFTRLTPLARILYPKDDDYLLQYLNDDGQSIEPQWYIPIIPMVLVNGGEGIGTGWSCHIPNYNPLDLCLCLRKLMDNEPIPDLHPWYRGFTGNIEQKSPDKYLVQGIFEETGDNQLEITELPLRVWTQSYKEFLESLLEKGQIKDYKEYHSDTRVHFVVNLTAEQMQHCRREGVEKVFKLSSTLSTSNMVCFDAQGRIRKYSSAQEILKDFYHLRLEFYQKRKEFLVTQLTNELERLENKQKFILAICNGDLSIQNKKRQELNLILQSKGFKLIDDSFDYLLTMPLLSLTHERVSLLKQECLEKKQELNQLLSKTAKDLWRLDLDQFESEWETFQQLMDSQDVKSLKAKPAAAVSRKKPKKKKIYSVSDESLSEEEEDDDDDDDFQLKVLPKKRQVSLNDSPSPQKKNKIQSFIKMKSSTTTIKPTTTNNNNIKPTTTNNNNIKPTTTTNNNNNIKPTTTTTINNNNKSTKINNCSKKKNLVVISSDSECDQPIVVKTREKKPIKYVDVDSSENESETTSDDFTVDDSDDSDASF